MARKHTKRRKHSRTGRVRGLLRDLPQLATDCARGTRDTSDLYRAVMQLVDDGADDEVHGLLAAGGIVGEAGDMVEMILEDVGYRVFTTGRRRGASGAGGRTSSLYPSRSCSP
ncbi:MAG: hypothetical protein IT175_12165 [Acidobacteria bacterium]|nr:hypothetical protein [Acidobacteriota bacterium]